MKTIAIYGVGLIGGSLALCYKGREEFRVIGHSVNPASVAKYMQHEVVDHATTSFEEVALAADFIFLCVPVSQLEPYMRRLSALPLKPGCIITDVGSTKASVTQTANAIDWPEQVHFIGGHPMAGSERSGVEAASSILFENAYYVLTPDANTPDVVYNKLAELLEWTHAHIIRVEPHTHDEIVGAISHLPHLIAAALVNQVAGYNKDNPLYEQLAAGGFRDITRIASCDPHIWRDIFLNNKEIILRQVEDWNQQVAEFAQKIAHDDGDAIVQLISSASAFRGRLPERSKGAMPGSYDVFVDVPDHPGVIGQITSEFGNHQINLSNIQINESRVDVPGIMRLSFRHDQDRQKAVELLRGMSYRVSY